MTVADTLRRAETDGKVKALFIRLPESGMEPAAAEENSRCGRRKERRRREKPREKKATREGGL
mgnify:CR=1 FL=1